MLTSRPHLPLELFDTIIQIIASDESPYFLRTSMLCKCALVSRALRHCAHKQLFRHTYLDFSNCGVGSDKTSAGCMFLQLCRSSPWCIGRYAKDVIVKDVTDWTVFRETVPFLENVHSLTFGGCLFGSGEGALTGALFSEGIRHLSIQNAQFSSADAFFRVVAGFPSLASFMAIDIAVQDSVASQSYRLPDPPRLKQLTVTRCSSVITDGIVELMDLSDLEHLTVSSDVSLALELTLPRLTIEHQDGAVPVRLALVACRFDFITRKDVDALERYLDACSTKKTEWVHVHLLMWRPGPLWKRVDERLKGLEISIAAHGIRNDIEREFPRLREKGRLKLNIGGN